MNSEVFFQRCIREEFESRCKRRSGYSLRAFAKSMGVDSGSLSQLLSGSRGLSYQKAAELAERLKLENSKRQKFLISVAEFQKRRNLKRNDPRFQAVLKRARLGVVEEPRQISQENFQVISEWYHFAILQLVKLPYFKESPQWVASQLEITVAEAKLAIDRLLKLGLLKRGICSLERTEESLTTADKNRTTKAHRKRQQQVIQKSLESLHIDPIEKRNHSSITIAIDPEKLTEAKTRIQNFMHELAEFMESDHPKRVYELTVNLFPIQKEN